MMDVERFFNTESQQYALGRIGDMIAAEILEVMSYDKPWTISQRWGRCDIFANTYGGGTVRVEIDGKHVLIYKGTTKYFKIGSWMDEIRAYCLGRIMDGAFKKRLNELTVEAEKTMSRGPSFIYRYKKDDK